MNPMGLSSPWGNSLEIIDLQPVKQIQGMNPMDLNAPWSESLEIIFFWTVRNILRDQPNGT